MKAEYVKQVACAEDPSISRPSSASNAVAKQSSLQGLTGVWAHSAADCEAHLSGKLDQQPSYQSRQKEVIGICADEIGLVYSAASCGVQNVIERSDTLEFLAACEVKGEPLDQRVPVTVSVKGPNEIAFSDKQFLIYGRYVKCTQKNDCSRPKE